MADRVSVLVMLDAGAHEMMIHASQAVALRLEQQRGQLHELRKYNNSIHNLITHACEHVHSVHRLSTASVLTHSRPRRRQLELAPSQPSLPVIQQEDASMRTS